MKELDNEVHLGTELEWVASLFHVPWRRIGRVELQLHPFLISAQTRSVFKFTFRQLHLQ